ncbi:DUF3047 domain-containing protein [Marivita hallyeonensis]|uniref:DUF3047 domain-containing protein n=1 Tax=Marivita hallyeonensis TaxID=996342 RepID=A0A1M5NYW5_9RHOB|nr:DUF3047 domain-containing protein [Marivita hallyeonensis]SHG94730.1 Protein of unknown function [Marivita hallyeonensis]
MRSLLAAFLTCAFSLPVLAAPVSFDGSWKTQKFSLFSSNTYGFNGNSVSVASDGSVSLAYRQLDTSFWDATSARWSWRVDEGVPATDLRNKGGDDRNLALYFVFLPQSEAESLRGASVRRLLTNNSARVLVYVWGGAHNRGAVLSSPYLGNRGRTIVLRGSGTGSESENVDLARDYANAFGGSAALVGIALSGDSDDTNSRIRASISGLQVN